MEEVVEEVVEEVEEEEEQAGRLVSQLSNVWRSIRVITIH